MREDKQQRLNELSGIQTDFDAHNAQFKEYESIFNETKGALEKRMQWIDSRTEDFTGSAAKFLKDSEASNARDVLVSELAKLRGEIVQVLAEYVKDREKFLGALEKHLGRKGRAADKAEYEFSKLRTLGLIEKHVRESNLPVERKEKVITQVNAFHDSEAPFEPEVLKDLTSIGVDVSWPRLVFITKIGQDSREYVATGRLL